MGEEWEREYKDKSVKEKRGLQGRIIGRIYIRGIRKRDRKPVYTEI